MNISVFHIQTVYQKLSSLIISIAQTLGIALVAARTLSKASIADTLGIALGAAQTVSKANIADTLGSSSVPKKG